MKYEVKGTKLIKTEVTLHTVKPSDIYDTLGIEKKIRTILQGYDVIDFRKVKVGDLFIMDSGSVYDNWGEFSSTRTNPWVNNVRFIVKKRAPGQKFEDIWE